MSNHTKADRRPAPAAGPKPGKRKKDNESQDEDEEEPEVVPAKKLKGVMKVSSV